MRSRGARRRAARTATIGQQTALKMTINLRGYILHWLLALERYKNLRGAPQRSFALNQCVGDNGNHLRPVRFLAESGRINHIICTVDSRYSNAALQDHVIARLCAMGFTVDGPSLHDCGCTTFIVGSRCLAGQ